MPLYTYVALGENGAQVSGDSAADSEGALRTELASRGLFVQKVRTKRSRLAWRRPRVSTEDFALFNQEFIALVRAGLTVPDALALASERPDAPALSQVLIRVLEDVRNGLLLSGACERHPEAFERLYIAALRTSEKTGDLAGALQRHQEYLRHKVAMRKKIQQALTYPVFLLVALAVILAALFLFVLPRFVAMYADLGAELPLPTRVLMSVVTHIYMVAPPVIAAAVLGRAAWRRWAGTASGKRRVDHFLNGLPYIGDLIKVIVTARLSRSLATLLSGGTPLVEALRTAAGSMSNQIYLERLQKTTQQITEGGSFAHAVRATGLMPQMAARMIEVGEASGGLDGMLGEVARFNEELLDAKLTRLMSLMEPVLMLLIGTIVGGIIIIMYLPVFHVADIIK
jgi:type IV pilus assembly protein PilC